MLLDSLSSQLHLPALPRLVKLPKSEDYCYMSSACLIELYFKKAHERRFMLLGFRTLYVAQFLTVYYIFTFPRMNKTEKLLEEMHGCAPLCRAPELLLKT